MHTEYDRKFTNLIRTCHEAKNNEMRNLFVHHPEVLGDNYDEIVESLNCIADAELTLTIVPRDQRAK